MRKYIMEKLKKNNIYCNISYPFPVHLMRGYSYLKYKKGDFPVAEKLSKRIFSLPMYPQLKDYEILKIVKCLKAAGA
jgi:aminotransferase EvaB